MTPNEDEVQFQASLPTTTSNPRVMWLRELEILVKQDDDKVTSSLYPSISSSPHPVFIIPHLLQVAALRSNQSQSLYRTLYRTGFHESCIANGQYLSNAIAEDEHEEEVPDMIYRSREGEEEECVGGVVLGGVILGRVRE